MSATVSPATAKQYGISRTGTVLAWPRSSFSFQRSLRPKPAGKPGPKPQWSDAEVLQFIHRDLERSPLSWPPGQTLSP